MNVKVFFFFIGLGWLILILESTLLNYMSGGRIHPDLLMAIVVHLGVGRRGRGGTLIALVYAWLLGLFSGRGPETYILVYPLTYEIIAGISAHFNLQGRSTQAGLVFVMSGFAASIHEVLPILFAESGRLRFHADRIWVHMILSGVGAYMLFPMLRRVRMHFFPPQTPLEL